jgi:hypothetical protein
LSVTDSRRRYQGTPIDNVRVPLGDDQVIHDYIAAAAEALVCD